MHVRREDMHIYVSSLLKCKMHLHDFVEGHLHYATVEFEGERICIFAYPPKMQNAFA
jgi:hypothetical protein